MEISEWDKIEDAKFNKQNITTKNDSESLLRTIWNDLRTHFKSIKNTFQIILEQFRSLEQKDTHQIFKRWTNHFKLKFKIAINGQFILITIPFDSLCRSNSYQTTHENSGMFWFHTPRLPNRIQAETEITWSLSIEQPIFRLRRSLQISYLYEAKLFARETFSLH